MRHSQSISKQEQSLLKKSLWREKGEKGYHFFCPQCRSKRAISVNPKSGTIKQYAQVFLTSSVFTLLAWPWLTWKGMVVFLPFWAIYEIYHRLRLRAALPCPNCGFDPYLYLVDVKKARQEIDQFWRKKFQEKGVPYPGEGNEGNATRLKGGLLDQVPEKSHKEH
jgi:predicted RNA-binding Zn-ribbon protein involved in translation (DUF1610 family)